MSRPGATRIENVYLYMHVHKHTYTPAMHIHQRVFIMQRAEGIADRQCRIVM